MRAQDIINMSISNQQEPHQSQAYFWHDKRVVVTGGAGFLGSFVVEKLRERGATRIFVPRKAEYDLRGHSLMMPFTQKRQNCSCKLIVSVILVAWNSRW
jgi:FlaA1/EpsC-like NDP-sugar epimerase